MALSNNEFIKLNHRQRRQGNKPERGNKNRTRMKETVLALESELKAKILNFTGNSSAINEFCRSFARSLSVSCTSGVSIFFAWSHTRFEARLINIITYESSYGEFHSNHIPYFCWKIKLNFRINNKKERNERKTFDIATVAFWNAQSSTQTHFHMYFLSLSSVMRKRRRERAWRKAATAAALFIKRK